MPAAGPKLWLFCGYIHRVFVSAFVGEVLLVALRVQALFSVKFIRWHGSKSFSSTLYAFLENVTSHYRDIQRVRESSNLSMKAEQPRYWLRRCNLRISAEAQREVSKDGVPPRELPRGSNRGTFEDPSESQKKNVPKRALCLVNTK